MSIDRASARSKRPVEDAPTQVSMRPSGIRTKPSTDQKKVRRAMSRGVKKTAAEFAEGDRVLIDGDQVATYSGADWLGTPAPDGLVWVEIDGDVVAVAEDRISAVAAKEAAVDTSPAREARILQAMAVATPAERRRLTMDLDDLRAQRRASLQSERDVDLANTVVAAHLTPIRVHERNTAETDWLGTVATYAGDPSTEVKAEATLWFKRVHSAVLADREEFAIQAQGAARRVAGAYGAQMEAAERAFLDHVAHLVRVADSPKDPANPEVEVDVEQSGNAESTVTDYDTQADQEPYLGEDWDGGEAAEHHPPMPGAGGQQPTAVKIAKGPEDDDYDPFEGKPFGEMQSIVDREETRWDDFYGEEPGDAQDRWYASRKQAERETCGAEKPSQFDGQAAQTVRCFLEKGHEGEHMAVVLDTDDNAVTERWHTAARKQAASTPREMYDAGVAAGRADAEAGVEARIDLTTLYPRGWNSEISQQYGDGPSYFTQGYAAGYTGKEGARKTAVSLTNIGIDSDGNGTGKDPSGNTVKFRLSDKDRADLKAILYSDMAINFSGVDVDESEIISTASRTAADDRRIDSDKQSGNAESDLDHVEVGDPNDRPMWDWELDRNQPGTGAADVAAVPTPGAANGYPQPTARRKQAVDSTGHNPYPPQGRSRAPKDGEEDVCGTCGAPIIGMEYAWYHAKTTASLNPVTAQFRARVQAYLRKQADVDPDNWRIFHWGPFGADLFGTYASEAEARAAFEEIGDGELIPPGVNFDQGTPPTGDWSSWYVHNNID